MPSQQYQIYNFAAGSVASPNAAETVIGTTGKVNSSYAGCTFGVVFVCEFSVGAAATSVTFNIRRGSLTGALVYTGAARAVTASTLQGYIAACTDQQVGEVAGAAYVLTATVAGGAAAGAATNVFSTVTIAE